MTPAAARRRIAELARAGLTQRQIAARLTKEGTPVSTPTVCRVLKATAPETKRKERGGRPAGKGPSTATSSRRSPATSRKHASNVVEKSADPVDDDPVTAALRKRLQKLLRKVERPGRATTEEMERRMWKDIRDLDAEIKARQPPAGAGDSSAEEQWDAEAAGVLVEIEAVVKAAEDGGKAA